MVRIISAIAVLLISFSGIAQSADTSLVSVPVDVLPEFPGGTEALSAFLSDNVVYPLFEKENGISGQAVVKFLVDKEGKVDSLKIIKSVSAGIDNEVIRVMKLMPAWKPGTQNGKPVNVYFSLPVRFSLHDTKNNKGMMIAEFAGMLVGTVGGIYLGLLLVNWMFK